MAKGQGVVKQVSEYYVVCGYGDCWEDMIYHGWRMKSAEKHWRKEGWSKKGGIWHCPECKNKKQEEYE